MTPAVASHSETHAGRTSYTDVATGHGVEVSLAIWPPKKLVSYGVFTQVQRYLSYNGDHNRYAFGFQASWLMFAAEAGIAYREADHVHRGTAMVHFGPVVSLAFFNFGGRFGIPLSPGSHTRPAHGTEASFTMAVKFPIPVL